eukprot:scaffold4629_cov75-Cylindrotheca_fusiformis.AAC.1
MDYANATRTAGGREEARKKKLNKQQQEGINSGTLTGRRKHQPVPPEMPFSYSPRRGQLSSTEDDGNMLFVRCLGCYHKTGEVFPARKKSAKGVGSGVVIGSSALTRHICNKQDRHCLRVYEDTNLLHFGNQNRRVFDFSTSLVICEEIVPEQTVAEEIQQGEEFQPAASREAEEQGENWSVSGGSNSSTSRAATNNKNGSVSSSSKACRSSTPTTFGGRDGEKKGEAAYAAARDEVASLIGLLRGKSSSIPKIDSRTSEPKEINRERDKALIHQGIYDIIPKEALMEFVEREIALRVLRAKQEQLVAVSSEEAINGNGPTGGDISDHRDDGAGEEDDAGAGSMREDEEAALLQEQYEEDADDSVAFQFHRTNSGDDDISTNNSAHTSRSNSPLASCLTFEEQRAILEEQIIGDTTAGEERDQQEYQQQQNQEQLQEEGCTTQDDTLLSNINYLLTRHEDLLESRTLPPTPHLLSEVRLLKLIRRYKLPLGAFKGIQQWAYESAYSGHDFATSVIRSRESAISDLRHRMAMPHNEFVPRVIRWLPDERATVLYIRSFKDGVFELLSNASLTTDKNISLPHPTNPYKSRPDERTEYVSELHHGKWWSDTWDAVCQEERNEILCPVFLYMDSVATDHNGRLNVTPLNMSLGIYNTATRKKVSAWTALYYHPDNESEAAFHKQKTKPMDKLQNLHNGLDAALSHFHDTSIEGLRWNHFPYAGKLWDVHMHFSICLVVGDTEMHDALCGKYNCRNSKVRVICRHCDCPTKDIVTPQAVAASNSFNPQRLDATNTENDAEHFRLLSHHPIKNAFHKLCFGCNAENIHMGCPAELLHMHQKGLCIRCIEALEHMIRGCLEHINGIPVAAKQVNIKVTLEELNKLGHEYGGMLNHQSDRDLPRTKFKNSLFSTTKKAGHEHAGVLLNLLLAMLSDRGRQILLEHRTINEGPLEDKVYLFELALCFESWLRKDVYHRSELENLQEGLNHYVDHVRNTCHRKGMGPLLIKNHLVLHVPEYIDRWGPPAGWDSGPSESHHKTEVKIPANNTQRRQASFLAQVSKRYDETVVIRKAEVEFGITTDRKDDMCADAGDTNSCNDEQSSSLHERGMYSAGVDESSSSSASSRTSEDHNNDVTCDDTNKNQSKASSRLVDDDDDLSKPSRYDDDHSRRSRYDDDRSKPSRYDDDHHGSSTSTGMAQPPRVVTLVNGNTTPPTGDRHGTRGEGDDGASGSRATATATSSIHDHVSTDFVTKLLTQNTQLQFQINQLKKSLQQERMRHQATISLYTRATEADSVKKLFDKHDDQLRTNVKVVSNRQIFPVKKFIKSDAEAQDMLVKLVEKRKILIPEGASKFDFAVRYLPNIKCAINEKRQALQTAARQRYMGEGNTNADKKKDLVPPGFADGLLFDKYRDYEGDGVNVQARKAAFNYFVDRLLPKIYYDTHKFKKDRTTKLLSEFVNVSDEAFAVLVVMNYVQRWEKQLEGGDKKAWTRSEYDGKFTSSNKGSRVDTWGLEGHATFIKLTNDIKDKRGANKRTGEKLEKEILERHKIRFGGNISSRSRRRVTAVDNGATNNEFDSVSNGGAVEEYFDPGYFELFGADGEGGNDDLEGEEQVAQYAEL